MSTAQKTPGRLTIVHGVLLVFALALIAKAGYEQLFRSDYWSKIGQRQHYVSSGLPAPRGQILDATGRPLVESREMVRISVAPRQVRNRAALARDLKLASVDPRFVSMSLDTMRKWVDVPGAFLPNAVAPAIALRGVYSKPVMDRVYATSGGIRRIVGRVTPEGKALDGIELALDSLLRGDTATVRVARDKSGRPLAAPDDADDPTPGSTVVLTINRELQEICDRALAVAVDSLHADGGDIVVMNPNTGDVLAMASNRADPAAVANTAVTEPYEPGSTMKPFVAARLLQLGRATPGSDCRYLRRSSDDQRTYDYRRGRAPVDPVAHRRDQAFEQCRHCSFCGSDVGAGEVRDVARYGLRNTDDCCTSGRIARCRA